MFDLSSSKLDGNTSLASFGTALSHSSSVSSYMDAIDADIINAPVFDQGFKHLLSEGNFSDLTICTKNKEFKTHRLLMSYSSTFFNEILQDDKLTKIQLDEPKENELHLFLQYIYQGLQ